MAKLPQPRDERASKKAEIDRANDLLVQLRQEIRILEVRRDDYRAAIDKESELLLSKREGDLRQLEAEHEKRLEPLQDEYAKLVRDISVKQASYQKLESEHFGIETQLVAERTTLGQISREIDAKSTELAGMEAASTNISAQITSLNGSINPLREELARVTAEVREAKAKREDVERDIVHLQEAMTNRKADLELEIDGLEHKRRDLALDVSEETKSMQAAREELANWEQNLQKKDKILRAREYKVTVDEQKIADNAGLLNL